MKVKWEKEKAGEIKQENLGRKERDLNEPPDTVAVGHHRQDNKSPACTGYMHFH
jgi:hypothetical protein